MHVLIVEDNASFADLLIEMVGDLDPTPQTTLARSSSAAVDALGRESFDVVLLDRKLPSGDDTMDAEEEHGNFVYATLRTIAPGTPICFVTAYDTRDFWYAREEDAQNVDLWGSNVPEPLIRTVSKANPDRLKDVLNHYIREIEALRAIEIRSSVVLDPYEKRVLRHFARRSICRSVDVRPLSGGLSGVRVLRVLFKDNAGIAAQTCVVRIGSHEEIREEYTAYMQHVVRLPNGSYAAFNGMVEFGAAKRAGIFYTLISDFESLLALVQKDEGAAVRIVQAMRQNSFRWTANHPEASLCIRDIRKTVLNDAAFMIHESEMKGLDYRGLRGFQCKLRCLPSTAICTRKMFSYRRQDPYSSTLAELA